MVTWGLSPPDAPKMRFSSFASRQSLRASAARCLLSSCDHPKEEHRLLGFLPTGADRFLKSLRETASLASRIVGPYAGPSPHQLINQPVVDGVARNLLGEADNGFAELGRTLFKIGSDDFQSAGSSRSTICPARFISPGPEIAESDSVLPHSRTRISDSDFVGLRTSDFGLRIGYFIPPPPPHTGTPAGTNRSACTSPGQSRAARRASWGWRPPGSAARRWCSRCSSPARGT